MVHKPLVFDYFVYWELDRHYNFERKKGRISSITSNQEHLPEGTGYEEETGSSLHLIP